MLDLREILEDLYDAGFFAAYPNPGGRVTIRREAIEAAEEAINPINKEIILASLMKCCKDGGLIEASLRVKNDWIGCSVIEIDPFVETLMERLNHG